MRNVYIASDNIISSLGFTTEENAAALQAGITGIKLHTDEKISPAPFWASLIDNNRLSEKFSGYSASGHYTRFEQLLICSLMDALENTAVDINSPKTLLILSTTKGNIDMLDREAGKTFEPERLYLWNTGRLLQHFFRLAHRPWIVSNACISGVLAITTGSRLIRSGRFDHVVVAGADLVTEFVLSGFNSFLSLCTGPCKPFDKDRQGLSLGEAGGTVILTADKSLAGKDGIVTGQGFSTNDANHISGPSRTGEGLYIAIKRILDITDRSIDYISAHGTATPYNDEMESVALTRAELANVPVNSLKGYWGHTLGAAGIIESIAGTYSLKHNLLLKTLGFSTMGVTNPIAVIDNTRNAPLQTFLKIASGFGGSNASLLFHK